MGNEGPGRDDDEKFHRSRPRSFLGFLFEFLHLEYPVPTTTACGLLTTRTFAYSLLCRSLGDDLIIFGKKDTALDTPTGRL